MAGLFHLVIFPRKILPISCGVEVEVGDLLAVLPVQVVHEGQTAGHVGHVLVGLVRA